MYSSAASDRPLPHHRELRRAATGTAWRSLGDRLLGAVEVGATMG